MRTHRPTWVLLIALITVAAIGVQPAQAGATADTTLRVSPTGEWIGGDIVSLDPATQTLATKIKRGQNKIFDVCVEQDSGSTTEVVATSQGDKGKLLATWTDNLGPVAVGDAEIAAGYARSTDNSLCMTLKIKVKATANPGSKKTWTITGDLTSYTLDTDVAAITVTVGK